MSEYNINDYLKDDKELQKVVIQELLEELKRLEVKNKELEHKLDWLAIAHKSEQEERTKLELLLAKIIIELKSVSDENFDQWCLAKDILDKIHEIL